MEQLSAWVGAGIVTAGLSAALLAGAGTASAGTGSGSDSGGAASGSTSSDAGKPASTGDKKVPAGTKKDADAKDKPESTGDQKDPDQKDADQKDADEKDAAKKPDDSTSDSTGAAPTDQVTATAETHKKKSASAEPSAAGSATAEPTTASEPAAKSTEKTEAVTKPVVVDALEPAKEPVVGEPTNAPETVPVVESTVEPVANHSAAQLVSARLAPPASVAKVTAADVTPVAPSILGFVGSVIGAVVVNVGSVALTALQAVEALAAGTPVLPPGSTVTVRDSWITLETGQRVAANWYYPQVKEGDPPPSRMILLSHGLLALGPMYSYTAANLAEQTQSIVVTPSITSNLFLGDDYWLGGTGMAAHMANLFVGDRTALTQSALDAGYATQYGLDPATAKLPQKFGLEGHSLGGNLVPAMAGFLAQNGAAADLVGVIALDGVPTGTIMVDALKKLDDYDAATEGDQFIPIREIGAPFNLFNSVSNIDEALTDARPDRYKGVVLTGGVHMDSMRGGNPLIQFAAYVVAGFPESQNPPAVDALAAQWFNEWFAGDTDSGDDLEPGSTIDILTPQGTAQGVVIWTPPAAQVVRLNSLMLQQSAPTDIPEANATLASLAA